MKRNVSTVIVTLAVAFSAQLLPARSTTISRANTNQSKAFLATETFDGDYREIPKTSIARDGTKIASVKSYKDLHSLLVTLPPDEAMRSKYPGLRKSVKKPNWPAQREPEEIRNVRIKSCWIVSAKHEGGDGDRDFHVVVSNSPTNFSEVMNAEVSGLPKANTADFNTLRDVRALFLTLSTNAPSSSFTHLKPPKHVILEGSLYFDGYHGAGKKNDPGPAWAKPQSVWEIHPIYKLTPLN
jgi:hypothetical protein